MSYPFQTVPLLVDDPGGGSGGSSEEPKTPLDKPGEDEVVKARPSVA